MTAYKARGIVVAHRIGDRIPIPKYEGDTSTVPGSVPFYETVLIEISGEEVVLPVGLVPHEIGSRVMVTVEPLEEALS